MIREVLYTITARFGTLVMSFLTIILVSNYLGDSGRGEQALIVLGISLICLFTNLASGSALVILAPQYDGKALLFIAYSWVVGSAIMGWIGLGLFGNWTGHGLDMLLTSIIFSFWSANANYLLGREKSRWFNLLNFLQAFILLVYLLVVAYIGKMSLGSFINALYISHTVVWLASIRPTWQNLSSGKKQRKEILRKFVHHGGFVQLANLAQLLKYRYSYAILEKFAGLGVLGRYSNAVAIAEGVWLITRSIATVHFSRVANMEDIRQSRKLTVTYSWLSVVMSGGAMLVLLLLPDRFFVFVLGKDFHGMHQLLLYLSPAILALSGSNIISHYFSGSGKNHVNFIGSLLGLLIIIPLCHLLIPGYGLLGAAIATSVSFAATMVFHLLWFRFEKLKETP